MTEASQKNIFIGFYLGLGDVICAHQALSWFALKNKECQIFIGVGKGAASAKDLFEWPTNIEFIIFVLPRMGSLSAILKFWKDFTRRKYVRVISSPHSPLPRASWKIPIFMKVIYLLGYGDSTEGPSEDPFSFFYEKSWPISRSIPLPSRDRAFFTLISLDEAKDEYDFPTHGFVSRVRWPKRVAIGIHVGASLANRRWPAKNIARLCWLIRERFPDHEIDLLGFPDELNEIVSQELPKNINISIGSLEETVARVKSLSAIVTMDSGFMHVASTFRIPQVAIFGPSSIKSIFPDNPKAVAVHGDLLSCQPCDLAKCKFERNYCMLIVTPEQVLAGLIHATELK